MVLLYITCPDLLDEVSCWRQIFFSLCVLFFIQTSFHSFSLSASYSLIILFVAYTFFSSHFSISSFLFLYSQCTSFFLSYYFDMSLNISLSLNASLLFFLSVSREACLLYTIPIGLEEFGIKWSGSKYKPSSPTKLNTEGLVFHSCPLFLLNNHVYFQMNRLLMI